MDPFITLGSPGVVTTTACIAAACTAAYKIICKYLEYRENQEVTIEKDGVKIIIKGHPIDKAKSLIDRTFPGDCVR